MLASSHIHPFWQAGVLFDLLVALAHLVVDSESRLGSRIRHRDNVGRLVNTAHALPLIRARVEGLWSARGDDGMVIGVARVVLWIITSFAIS